MVEKATSLEDLSTKGDWIGVTVAHSFEHFDFVVYSLRDGCSESGLNIRLDIYSVFSNKFRELSKCL